MLLNVHVGGPCLVCCRERKRARAPVQEFMTEEEPDPSTAEDGDGEEAAAEEDEEDDGEAPSSESKAPPPPEPVIMDEDMYMQGLVMADHATGINYARYSKPRANVCTSSQNDSVTQEIRGRDRLKRVAPTSFTFGGYRSQTGQTTRFKVQ